MEKLKFNLEFGLWDTTILVVGVFIILFGIYVKQYVLLGVALIFLPSIIKRAWRAFHFLKLKSNFGIKNNYFGIEIPISEIEETIQPSALFYRINTLKGSFILHKSYIVAFDDLEERIDREVLGIKEQLKIGLNSDWILFIIILMLVFNFFHWLFNVYHFGFFFDLNIEKFEYSFFDLFYFFSIYGYLFYSIAVAFFNRFRNGLWNKTFLSFPINKITKYYNTDQELRFSISNRNFHFRLYGLTYSNKTLDRLKNNFNTSKKKKSHFSKIVIISILLPILFYYLCLPFIIPEKYLITELLGTLSTEISTRELCSQNFLTSIKLNEYPGRQFVIKRNSNQCSDDLKNINQNLPSGFPLKITISKKDYVSMNTNPLLRSKEIRPEIIKIEKN